MIAIHHVTSLFKKKTTPGANARGVGDVNKYQIHVVRQHKFV